MSWLTGTVILLCLTFGLSHASLEEPTPTTIKDHGVPRLDLESLESGYHGLVKENESLVEVTPQIRALGAKICSFHIANKHHGEAPFEILLKENGVAKLKALRVLNCEKRRNYKFDIAAVACNGAQSESAAVHITVVDVNEYAPQFLQPAYVSTVDEGRLYEEVVRVEASDRDCTPKYGDVCKYEILTDDQPFTIDNEGAIRNTEPLDYERSHNYILSVVAYDCGMKQSAPAMVTVKVNRVCSPGWRGVPERVDYAAGVGSQPLLPSARLELCDAPCTLRSLRTTLSLATDHIGKGCDRDTYSVQSQRKLCGASRDSVDLLPTPGPSTSWTSLLSRDEGREADEIFEFDGANSAAIVPNDVLEHALAQKFTIGVWIKHRPRPRQDPHVKEHILCAADDHNNKVLNLQTLKQIQKVPFLLHELIKPIGDLAILLSRLEEIQKAENDHSEFSNTKNPNDFADPSLLNDDLLREINENYIVQPGCSQDILFHKTPSGNQQIIKSLLQSNSSKDIQIIEQTVQSELNWNQDTENIEKLVNSICSDKTEIVDNIGQPSCSRKRDKQTPRESKSKRVCKWIVSQEILQINLEDLLKNSSKGRTILQFYQQNKLLNSQSRSILIHIVGEKLLELNRNPSANDYEQVDTKIRQLFPSEPQFVYFIRAKVNGKNQKNHEGKLPNYIRNVKYRNAKLLHQEGVVDTEDSDEAEVNVESKVSNDVLNADGWLKENLEPWSEVEKKWKSTHHFRLNSLTSSENTFLPISQYYENYKVLRLVLGYTLLEADFELRYPNSVQALSSDWNLKQAALLKLIGLECHSAEIKDTIDNFKSFTNDEKDNLLFQLLPYLFPKQPKSRGKKSQSITPRPTQIESQEAFILHVKSPNDIDPAIMRRLNQMKKKEKLQPFILCVGTTRAKLSRSYCIIDTIKYEFPNLKKAFDVCFKAIFALHTEYSQEAYQPWLFVQQALYDIFTEYDKKSANISTMVGNFKTLVNIQRTTEIVNLEEH